MTTRAFNILGMCGSLRQGSYNRGLLRAAQEVAPPGVEVDIYEGLADIPPYNADVDAQGKPESVLRLNDAIRAADALLIASPEYNYNIPGFLKNAIDWVSRPAAETPLRFKPIALMGASTGIGATIRSQLALRQVFLYTESYVLLKPEVLAPRAADRFDEKGNLVDQPTRDIIRAQLEALVQWARRLRRAD